jgi:acetolactate synthase-1/2/3 large subunit
MSTYTHGGELVARSLVTQGVDTIFTLCGGHIAPVYDGCLNHDIRIIDFRHEQAAAHAADAYARLTRGVGVAVVTAGPGVTDAVTGVANAYQSRSPLVLLGGAAPLKTEGMGALQEMEQVDLFQPITKASFTIRDTGRIPQLMAQAFRVALSGRPGPVFVELPFDVLFNTVDPPPIPPRVAVRPIPPDPTALGRVVDMLLAVHKPIIIAGSQVYWDGAWDALRELADQVGIPVFTNGAGRGTLPMDHPRCFRASRSDALKEADLALVIGTPLDFRLKYGGPGWNPELKLVQVDNDPADIGRNRPADVGLVADARLLLEGIRDELERRRAHLDFGDWLSALGEIESERLGRQAAWCRLDDAPVNHFRFAAEVDAFVGQQRPEDMLLIGDGGDIVATCAKVVTLRRPGQWLDPGPLGCLGIGTPFAIAAQSLYPGRRVLILSGDGSLGFNGFEFDTAVRFHLPIVAIVGNDAGWGQIRGPQIQMVGEERAVATSLALTRYDKVVEAMGGYGENVERPEGIRPALERAFASGRPACINVTLDPKGMAKTGASTPYIV